MWCGVLAKTDNLGSGKKGVIFCDALFYSQTHVTFRKDLFVSASHQTGLDTRSMTWRSDYSGG